MRMLGRVLVGIALLHVGCDDDDDDDHGVGPAVDGSAARVFDETLTTAAEVPVCASAGSTATGATTITISADRSTVTVNTLTFSGLSGPATAAHIHAAPPGVAGPIVLDLGRNPMSGITQTFTAADYPSPPPAGAPADFAAFVRQMLAGNSYLNVHTMACMPGEIRANLQ
jgi:hypothetical protein